MRPAIENVEQMMSTTAEKTQLGDLHKNNDEKDSLLYYLPDNEVATCTLSAVDSHFLEAHKEEMHSWTNGERQRWMFCMFVGQTVLYLCRTVMPVCAVAMSEDMKWSKREAGTVLGVFFWGYMTTQCVAGWLADKVGGEQVLTRAGFGWSAATALLALLPSLSWSSLDEESLGTLTMLIIFCRLLMGFFQGFHNPSVGSLMSHRVPLEHRGFTFAVQASGAHFGTLLCGSVGSVLVEWYGWKVPFYAAAGAALAWSLVVHMVMVPEKECVPAPAKLGCAPSKLCLLSILNGQFKWPEWPPWTPILRNRAFWAMLAGHYAHGHAYFILLSWLPTYFHDNFPDAKSWVFNVVPWLVTIPSAICSGVLADLLIRKGFSTTFVRKLLVCITLLGCCFFLVCLSFSTEYVTSLFYMAAALAMASFHSSGIMLNPQDLAPKFGGVVFGIMNMAGALPGFLGVYFAGYVLELTKSWSAVFNQTAFVCAVGCAVYCSFGSAEKII